MSSGGGHYGKTNHNMCINNIKQPEINNKYYRQPYLSTKYPDKGDNINVIK